MKTHQLKIWPIHFDDVASGKKRAEVRVNDRDFQVGDRLELREWTEFDYTGREILAGVTHVLKLDDVMGTDRNYVMLSIIVNHITPEVQCGAI